MAGSVIGDECFLGDEASLAPGVKVYPFKTIEAGALAQHEMGENFRLSVELLKGFGGHRGIVGWSMVITTAACAGSGASSPSPRPAATNPSSRVATARRGVSPPLPRVVGTRSLGMRGR